MEGKVYKILMLIHLVNFLLIGHALADDGRLQDYRCFFNDSFIAGKLGEWQDKIAEMEKTETDNLLWNLEVLKARYGLIGEFISSGRKQEAKKWIESTESFLDRLTKRYPKEPQLHCIHAGLIGYKIGITPLKAVFYGPQNQKKIDIAYSLNREEPLVWLERGNSDYFRPEAFGGNKEKALKYFSKSAELFEKKMGCEWLKYFAWTMVYNCLMKLDRKSEAEQLKNRLVTETGGLKWLSNGKKEN